MTLDALAGIVMLALLLTPPAMAALAVRDTRRIRDIDRKYRAMIARHIRKYRDAPLALDELADLIDPDVTP